MRRTCFTFLLATVAISGAAFAQDYCAPRDNAEREAFLAESLVWAGFINADIKERNPHEINRGRRAVVDRDARGYTGPFDERDRQYVCKRANEVRDRAGLVENYSDNLVAKLALPKAIVPIVETGTTRFVTRRSTSGEVLLTIGSRPIDGDAQAAFWAFYGEMQQKYTREWQNPGTPSTQTPFTKFHFEGFERTLPAAASTTQSPGAQPRKVYLTAVWRDNTLRYLKFSFPATPESVKMFEPVANAIFPTYVPFPQDLGTRPGTSPVDLKAAADFEASATAARVNAIAAKAAADAKSAADARAVADAKAATVSAVAAAANRAADASAAAAAKAAGEVKAALDAKVLGDAKSAADASVVAAKKSAADAVATANARANAATRAASEAKATAEAKTADAASAVSDAKRAADAAAAAIAKAEAVAKTAADQMTALCRSSKSDSTTRTFYVASNREVKRNPDTRLPDWKNERAETLSFASAGAYRHSRGIGFTWLNAEATPEQFRSAVNCDLNGPGERGTLLVFIHGSNTTFDKATKAFSEFAWDMKGSAAAVLFSWPAYNFAGEQLRDYNENLRNADNSRSDLREFLIGLKTLEYKKMVVISHSMGGYLVLGALREIALSNQLQSLRIDQVVFSAPDIDVALFRNDLIELGKQISPLNMTLYASKFDWPLAFSKMLRRSSSVRAGFVGDDDSWRKVAAIPGLYAIDVSGLKPREVWERDGIWGHSHHLNEHLQIHIGKLLTHGGTPEQRLNDVALEKPDFDFIKQEVGPADRQPRPVYWLVSRKKP
jgi:pimeloyl-ACP methyl ester carboxylesterase